jgi:uncharacterized protein
MSAARSTAPLDLRSPFVLDIRELGRRAGSMRELTRDVDAPSLWRLELVAVPEGAPVTLELRLESVMEGVLVSGLVHAPVAAECGRCLEPLRTTLHAPLQELFAYEPEPGDEEIPVVQGDFLDLEPVLRDAVVLALPLNPVCDDACPGLCAGCGVRLDDLPDDHSHETVDPRWAALASMRSAEPEES